MANLGLDDRHACIFDLDGTLVDSAPGITKALSLAFSQIGREVSADSLRGTVGPPVRIMARRVFPQLTDAEVDGVEQAFRAAYDEDGWRETTLYPGVLETLSTLRDRGYRLLIATNKPILPTTRVLKNLGLARLFEAVATRDAVSPPLPDKAAMLAHLLRTQDLLRETTTMVGDTEEDAQAAQTNGLAFIFMQYGYGDYRGAQQQCIDFKALLSTLT